MLWDKSIFYVQWLVQGLVRLGNILSEFNINSLYITFIETEIGLYEGGFFSITVITLSIYFIINWMDLDSILNPRTSNEISSIEQDARSRHDDNIKSKLLRQEQFNNLQANSNNRKNIYYNFNNDPLLKLTNNERMHIKNKLLLKSGLGLTLYRWEGDPHAYAQFFNYKVYYVGESGRRKTPFANNNLYIDLL